MRGAALAALALTGAALACAPVSPCATAAAGLARRRSAIYAGRWRVVRGDSLTLPELGDRFRLASLTLDTVPRVIGPACRLGGSLAFSVPRAETLAVTWIAAPDQALVYGWPVDLGPFGGLGVALEGDSLHGALLFDSRLGIEVRPGLTAQFVAARAPGH